VRRALTSLLLACTSTATQPAPKPEALPPPPQSSAETAEVPCPQDAGLCLAVEPIDAEITINGEARGRASDYSAGGGFLALEPGLYQIMLTAAGYQTWRGEVAVKAKAEPLEVTLERRGDP